MRRHKEKKFTEVRNIPFSLLIITICLLNLATTGWAQNTSSPYSRYGIGNLNAKNFGQSFAMGGTNIAMQNDSTPMFSINPNNPASNTSIRLTTAELGVNYNREQLISTGSKQTINTASLGYVSLAFPFKRWWGASIGLIPYSSVGYKVTDHQDITNIGGVDYLYEGSGGINQIVFGNGVKPLYGLLPRFLKSEKYNNLASRRNPDNSIKSDSVLNADRLTIEKIRARRALLQPLSVGFNTSYLFGGIDHLQRSIFPYGSGFYNTRTGTSTRVSYVYFDYGAQYAYTIGSVKYHDLKDTLNPIRRRELKEKVKLLFGVTFAAQSNIHAKVDSLSYSYYNDAQGYERIRDTMQNSFGTKGKITLPLSIGFGFGIKKGDKLYIAADFAMQNWSSYQAFNQDGGLKNSYRVSLGAQYVPNSKAGQGYYLKRMHYRLGARYAQTAFELGSTQLMEKAVTAGIGFPVGRNYLLQSFSMINVGVEYSALGTTNNGLIQAPRVRPAVRGGGAIFLNGCKII